MAPDAKTEAVTTACAEHPDMMLGETMKGMHGPVGPGRARGRRTGQEVT